MKPGALQVLLFLAPAAWAGAQADTTAAHAPKFVRIGIVYDSATQEVVANAIIRDRLTGNFVRSSSTGHFALTPTFVKSSGALLEVLAPGYERVGPVLVDPTESSLIEVKMARAVVPLAAMVTTETYRIDRDPGQWAGFDRRCSVKHVDCFDETTLAAHPSGTLYDFLVKAEGVRPWCGTSPVKTARLSPKLTQGSGTDKAPATCLAKMAPASGTGLCTPTYFLDGFEWAPLSGEAQIDLSAAFPPGEIKGIEVYESIRQRPLRFTGDPFCGAVVIWTK